MEAIKEALKHVPNNVNVLTSWKRIKEIEQLRRSQFKKYPQGGKAIDQFDQVSCILIGKNKQDEITSTGRIVFDSPMGLPAEKLVKAEVNKLRNQGLVIAELSKFAIAPEARGILRNYLWAYYEIGIKMGIDSYISINPSKDVNVYKKIYAARVLLPDIGYSYGTKGTFSLMEYKLKEVKPCLSKWLKETLS